MFNSSTIKHLLPATVTHSFIHCFLILFEYVCFIFPSSFQSASKIYYYGSPISLYKSSTPNVNLIFLIKYLHESSSSACQTIIFSLLIILLACYYITQLFGIPNHKLGRIPFAVLVHLMDLFLFRYFSSFLLDVFAWFFTDFYQYKDIGLNTASIMFFILFALFIFTTYNYITRSVVGINIFNPLLVNGKKRYPYDDLASNYQIYLLLLKSLIAIEFNYIRTVDTINSIIVCLNICIILLSFSLSFHFSFVNVHINFSCALFYANFELNSFRNVISIFNSFLCGFTLILSNNASNTYSYIIVILLLSLNSALFTLYFEYRFLFETLVKQQYITYELLLLLLIQDENSTHLFNYRSIIYSCYNKHLDLCKQTKCPFCLNINTDLKSYIDVFYKYLKKEEKTKTHSFSEELSKLLYYKLKTKSVKFFRLYYHLLRKYEKKNKLKEQTLRIVVEDWLIQDNNDHSSSIHKLIQMNKLESNTRTLLNELTDFYTENLKTKTPESVITLSNSIQSLITQFKLINVNNSNATEELSSNQSIESTKKTINGLMTYTSNLIRFIIQALTNQDIKGLPPIDIERLDEFLFNHFVSDHILVCSIDLKSSLFKREVNIVKITGGLSRINNEKKLLSAYFPKEIREEGINQFYNQIYSNKDNEKAFIYPFQIKCVVSYIKYSFSLIQTIESNNITLFGQYEKERKKALLLDLSNLSSVRILSFCVDLLTLMQFRRKWIGYLTVMNYEFNLQSIFKTVKYNQDKSSFVCEFDYDHYISSSNSIYESLRSSSEFQSNLKNEHQLLASIDTLNQYSGYVIVFSLEKITSYSNGCELYTLVLKTQCHLSILKKGINGRENTKDTVSVNGIANGNGNTKVEATQLNFQANTFQSTSFSKMKARISSIYFQSNQLIDSALQGKIEKETKRLALFSILMVCFNIILILICVIFLATQVSKSTDLAILNDLYFQFKSMRLCFTNFINTLGATSCYKLKPGDKGCINTYSQYSNSFISKYGLDPRLSLLEYSTAELKYKADFTQSVLTKIKKFVYSYHEMSFGSLLDDEMSYYEFDESSRELKMMKKTITFEAGIREYLNTMYILCEPNIHYELEPLVFISYSNGEYNFDSIPNNELSSTQRHLYKGLVNYMNFYNVFNNGEQHIMIDISTVGIENNKMNLIFMVTLACLNAFLGLFCIINIITAYHLFKILIINLVNQLENKPFLKNLTQKMADLSTLAKFYDKNPNDLIQKILKYQTTPSSNGSGLSNIEMTPSKEIDITNSPNQISFGNQFHITLLGRIMFVLASIFAIFFLVIIIFNSIIYNTYSHLFQVFNYTSLCYNFEDSIYSNIAFTALTHFCNITNEDFAGLIGRTNPPSGILNDLIETTLKEVQSLSVYDSLKSSYYPLPKASFNYNCDDIFFSFEDTFIKIVSDAKGLDYRIISQASCNAFNSLLLDNFFFLQSDLVDRTQKLANKIRGRSYEDLTEFNASYDLYELFTISIFIFRPIHFYYRRVVLLPTLSENFSSYVRLIGIYLGVNILLEILLFVVVRWVIISKLEQIRDNLYLFNHCVN